jgi:hypothetical protein
MGGKVSFIIGTAATALLYLAESTFLFWVSLVVTVILFWSWGIMHNYAFSYAKMRRERIIQNKELEGSTLEDINKIRSLPISVSTADMEAVPNYITLINMIASIASVVLLLIGLIKISL